MQTVQIALSGLGFVGRSMLELLEMRADVLRDRYGLQFIVVAAADSKGAVLNPNGLDVAALRAHKLASGRVDSFAGGVPGMDGVAMLKQASAQVLLEASPVNLQTGGAGLAATQAALQQGMHVVLANKAPLVLAYQSLHQLAAQHAAKLAFSATVCGSLPVLNILKRDLAACQVLSLSGIFNSTTNYILDAMANGRSFAEGLGEAQHEGIAETDPSLDIEGWDTANKLVIIMNTLLNQPVMLKDVAVTGIRGISEQDIRRAEGQGKVLRLLARADGGRRTKDERRKSTILDPRSSILEGWQLSVQPELISLQHPLASVTKWEMGIWLETDTMGTQFYKVDERGPLPTAAAMLRDLVNFYA